MNPDADKLLEAVAAFLAKDVMPVLDDPALAFRVRIAAHLVGVARREWAAAPSSPGASLREALAAELAVTNPAFDLNPDLGDDEWTT